MDGTPVEIALFGPLTVRVGGRTLDTRALDGAKPRHLMELLALHCGRAISKARLAELLWSERRPQRVAATVETYVSLLRRWLDRDGDLPGDLGRRVIVTRPGGYQVAAELVSTDVDRLEALLLAAAHDAGESRYAVLAQAIRIGEQELLADEPELAWLRSPREHYRARRQQALIDLAECAIELGRHQAGAVAAERALAAEPTSERACRAAMRAFDALGEPDSALRVFARCREALSDQLGTAPTRQTVDLNTAILRGRPASGPTAAAIRYADGAGARIAYQVIGDGATDLLFVPSFITNLGATWDDPTFAGFLRRLAGMSRLVLFDKRGTGLSDPALEFPTQQQRSDDLIAVLDAAGIDRAVLFGTCAGAALCAHFAADHPDRTAGLVTFGGFARLLATEEYPWGWPAELYQRFLDSFEEAWLGAGERQARRNPSLATNPRYRDWFGRFTRLAANPFMARRLAEMNADLDVRHLLPRIRTPALVIVRSGDVWMSAENSRYLAAHIAGARLVTLPGVDHDPWAGDTEPIVSEIRRFLASL